MATETPLKSIIPSGCRVLLGGTFIYAALNKLADPQAFAADIMHYRLLPYSLSVAFALYLPWVELICGISVICRYRERGALALTLGLCLLFVCALASTWIRGLDITCGCFGQESSASLPWAMGRSLGLGFFAGCLLWGRDRTEARV